MPLPPLYHREEFVGQDSGDVTDAGGGGAIVEVDDVAAEAAMRDDGTADKRADGQMQQAMLSSASCPRQTGDGSRANVPENPPWLLSQRPKMYHEQAVSYFFTHAKAASAKGQPLRFHMLSGRACVYGMIISKDMQANPGSHYVVFVPENDAVRPAASELRNFELRVGCVDANSVFLEEDTDVLVCSYENAPCMQARFFRIKVVEECTVSKGKPINLSARQNYETSVRRGVKAELTVHFATMNSGLESSGPRGAAAEDGLPTPQGNMETEYSVTNWIVRPYTMMWKAFIRPPRAVYADKDLGINTFVFGNHVYEREDVELQSSQGHKLACSHFYMRGGQALRQLCVVYLHGNCSSRLEAFYVLPSLLSRGLSVFCLDLAGSGKSGGEYISLGHHEEKDVEVALEHLRNTRSATAIGLWGRSMGAGAAVLRAAEDDQLAACVLDSPFSDLRLVVEEYLGGMNLHIPDFVLSMCLRQVRGEIQARAGFDPYELAPILKAPAARCPALFAVASDDAFILPHHTFDIHNAWGGERLLSQFTGGHTGRRPGWFMDEAADFLLDRLSSWKAVGRPSAAEKRRAFAL